jgi:hypothetical protein
MPGITGTPVQRQLDKKPEFIRIPHENLPNHILSFYIIPKDFAAIIFRSRSRIPAFSRGRSVRKVTDFVDRH